MRSAIYLLLLLSLLLFTGLTMDKMLGNYCWGLDQGVWGIGTEDSSVPIPQTNLHIHSPVTQNLVHWQACVVVIIIILLSLIIIIIIILLLLLLLILLLLLLQKKSLTFLICHSSSPPEFAIRRWNNNEIILLLRYNKR